MKRQQKCHFNFHLVRGSYSTIHQFNSIQISPSFLHMKDPKTLVFILEKVFKESTNTLHKQLWGFGVFFGGENEHFCSFKHWYLHLFFLSCLTMQSLLEASPFSKALFENVHAQCSVIPENEEASHSNPKWAHKKFSITCMKNCTFEAMASCFADRAEITCGQTTPFQAPLIWTAPLPQMAAVSRDWVEKLVHSQLLHHSAPSFVDWNARTLHLGTSQDRAMKEGHHEAECHLLFCEETLGVNLRLKRTALTEPSDHCLPRLHHFGHTIMETIRPK